MDYADLPTEQVNPDTRGLDLLDTPDLLAVIHEEDRRVPDAVRAALPDVARVVDAAATALGGGGRLIYVGAGTSGRLGVLDAAECPPTFGIAGSRVVGLIAGGRNAVFTAREGAEDGGEDGRRDIVSAGGCARDLVVGITSSGVTPYVLAALGEAGRAGARTALITCGPPRDDAADIVVRLDTGPEVLAGSTRMKAGTATKLVLNMISTAAMVRIGKVYDNLMVDLRAGSAKLRARSLRLLTALTALDGPEAAALLDASGGEVKTAIVAARLSIPPEDARGRLDAAGGRLRAALEGGEP